MLIGSFLRQVSFTVWSAGLFGGLRMILLINIISSVIFYRYHRPNRLAYALMRAGLPYRFGFMLITAFYSRLT